MSNVTHAHDGHEHTGDILCVECESPINDTIIDKGTTKTGALVCPECIELYYVACANCVLLIPQDESLMRDGRTLCADCYTKPLSTSTNPTLLENPEALISEYIALHAEEKRIKSRLDELKEALKEVATAQQRVSNAVTLRAGAQAVKCSFRASLKCNQEAVESIAKRLDVDAFEALFERKISYSPHKERVQELLNGVDEEHAEVRELLRAAVIETETATLTVVNNRKE